jgi:pterin-4a-carbinolamine dehydratase
MWVFIIKQFYHVQNHHPDMIVRYDNVKISITDHEEGGVSNKCHKFVNSINKL